MKSIYAIIVVGILTFFPKTVCGQAKVSCNNITLSNDTFFVSPSQNQISTVLYYKDTTAIVYFICRLLLSDTSTINSRDIKYGSILKFPFSETYKPKFTIDFNSNTFTNGSIISGFIHIFDSNRPGDSIATCYIPVTLILHNTLGTQIKNPEKLQIFPNPINELLTINIGDEIIKSININTIEGLQILNETFNSHVASLNTTRISKGVYFLNIITSRGQITKKIIKY